MSDGYTVFGIVNNATQPPRLTVAAVVEGLVTPVDENTWDEDTMRYASTFYVDSPEDAEAQAHAEVERGG